MAEVTAFSIRKDGAEVEKVPSDAVKAGKQWKKVGRDAPEGIRVTLHALRSDGSEELRGWSRKPLPSEWNTAGAREACQ